MKKENNQKNNMHTSREEWLRAATNELQPYFESYGYSLPENIRFAIAFTSGGKRGMEGECWHPQASADKHFEIIIKANKSDPLARARAPEKQFLFLHIDHGVCPRSPHGNTGREEHLRNWYGVLQSDAYSGYNALSDPAQMRGSIDHAFCWVHARRGFFKLADVESVALKRAQGKMDAVVSPLAVEAVKRMDSIFDIERAINGKPAEERLSNYATQALLPIFRNSCARMPSRGLARMDTLKLVTVAEGVETLEDWNLCDKLECDVAQGYFIGRPIPGEAFFNANYHPALKRTPLQNPATQPDAA
jgi:hypothetical protein